ncbi:hypothetical protein HF086_006298 [Spodoptera exigua]|uniref:Mon2/Sec7/BIG1-like dimerisation and cyclophilin-binding domain-containing protein n=1 Tax=Spodoptera exigua TaxID=7107 RepID=A0A922M2W3_SPOEX|nr:hypothetical protein HF086_006298 [Spodoptera exigua]
MAFVSAVTGDDSTKKFMDVLQNDFKNLSLETKKKYPQIREFCLGTIQRLIAQQGIDAKGARHVVDCLYNLGQGAVLELKLLQTAALLMTTSDLVHGDTLARTMVMCMRMVSPSESRDVSTSHAAAATVRQLVALVFERALAEAEAHWLVGISDVPKTFGLELLDTVLTDFSPIFFKVRPML